MIILKIIAFIFLFGLIYHFATLKWLNPYKLLFFFGKKGHGKSTLLTKDAYQAFKKGRKVYSNSPLTFQIRDPKTHKKTLVSTLALEPSHIWDYQFPPKSLVLIDEASLIWSNRDFKTIDPRVIRWFQQQRKVKVEVRLYSVSFDIDKKLRDLVDEMYLVRKYFRIFTVARHVVRKPVIVHPLGDAPASIQDDFVEDPPLMYAFGGIRVAFIPRWAKLFDTYNFVVSI